MSLLPKRLSSNLFGEENVKDDEKDSETPITIECDEILIILGPSLKYMTNHENINMEDTVDDLEESMEVVDLNSYDSLHYLKVVESRLRHRILRQNRQERIDRK